jgi:hypothetical protein
LNYQLWKPTTEASSDYISGNLGRDEKLQGIPSEEEKTVLQK